MRYTFTPRTGRRIATVVLSAVLASQLSACFPLAAAGFAAGTMAAVDRRTLGAQTDDRAIALRAESRISDRYGDRVHVNANSYNRKVLLTGEVPDAATKAAIQGIAGGVENVLSTVNELDVMAPSAFTARTSDALITGQVKAAFIDARDIYASAFKIVTERGTVYLMGRVTQREGNRAADITRNLRGVQKVVKVLEYITEEELTGLQAKPAPVETATESKR
jgi:osmotically-inducible protein OsmY